MADDAYCTDETAQDAFLDGEFAGRDRERERVLRLIDDTLTAAKKTNMAAVLRDYLLELRDDVANGVRQIPGTY